MAFELVFLVSSFGHRALGFVLLSSVFLGTFWYSWRTDLVTINVIPHTGSNKRKEVQGGGRGDKRNKQTGRRDFCIMIAQIVSDSKHSHTFFDFAPIGTYSYYKSVPKKILVDFRWSQKPKLDSLAVFILSISLYLNF